MNLSLLILAICTLASGTQPSPGALLWGPHREGGTTPTKSVQTGAPEGSLPADRYQQLRMQTLAHARLITGPRIKNPRLVDVGFDRNVVAALAEERAWRQSHLDPTLTSSGNHTLLTDQRSTLPGNVRANTAYASQPNSIDSIRQLPLRAPCTAPTIRSVNGKSANAVFTPIEPDNHFRIEGCSFGTVAGTIRLQPSARIGGVGPQAQQIPLHLDGAGAWKNDTIDVYIDSGLKSVSDFAADLVIQLPNWREAQLANCMFVAVRGEPQLLKTIPATWVTLEATSVSARPIQQLEFESPAFTGEQVPIAAGGTSAFVARSDSAPFASGRDTFDLSQLAPGWVVESVQLNVFDASCPGESSQAESNGTWTTNWTGHGFAIAWASETCAAHIPPLFNFTLSFSQYAVRVWLVGPAGTQPLRSGL